MTDIHDIRAPIMIPLWWRWPLVIAIAMLLSLAIVLAIRWWQKRREAKRTPLERARRALDAAEAHARAGRAHAWAEIVADTLRAALARKLGADVLPQTTTELARAPWARRAVMPDGTLQLTTFLPESDAIIELLETCDLARFALATVDANALVDHTTIARDLVEKLFAPEQKQKQTQKTETPVPESAVTS